MVIHTGFCFRLKGKNGGNKGNIRGFTHGEEKQDENILKLSTLLMGITHNLGDNLSPNGDFYLAFTNHEHLWGTLGKQTFKRRKMEARKQNGKGKSEPEKSRKRTVLTITPEKQEFFPFRQTLIKYERLKKPVLENVRLGTRFHRSRKTSCNFR